MKYRILSLAIAGFLVVTGFVSAVSAQSTAKKKPATGNQLVKLLPPSETAMAVNTKRFFDEAMPQLFSANQPMLDELLAKMDEIKSQTGVDLRQFDEVAIGTTAIAVNEKGFDFEPILLARGKIKTETLINAAKTASKDKYREEKIGERTVYVFSPTQILEENKSKLGGNLLGDFMAKMIVGFSKEMALTSYDDKTIVLGTLSRVREMFESKTRVSAEVQALVARKPGAIMSFGGKMPNGLDGFIQLDSDDLGTNLKSIRELAGSMDVTATKATLSVVARTIDQSQAESLKSMLTGLQSVFAPILKSSKNTDNKMYGRLLEEAKLTQVGNEVGLDVVVPKADVDKLIGKLKTSPK